MNALEYAKLGVQTIMHKFTPEELPPLKYRFHYHQGVFLTGVDRVYQLTGDEKMKDYIKSWVDFNVDKDGNLPISDIHQFDDIQPGMLLFDLYETTEDKRYKTVLDMFADVINKWPVNSLGAVWHKYETPNQMWLDCMYMMGVITAMYAKTFDRPDMLGNVYALMKSMRDKMTNPETGLMYHMYDDSRENEFVSKDSGLVEVHWGRAMGWYAVAMFEILEYLPKDYPHKQEFIDAGINLLRALVKYQDNETGLWYQVVDRVDDPKNWLESSCSALFTYAMAKAINSGVVDDSFKSAMLKGYEGVLSKSIVEKDALNMTAICIGTGVGDLDFYYERPTVTNDLHGMGAFLLMCTEVYKVIKKSPGGKMNEF